jgi:DNA-binding transcriptional ArsR family regulator
MLKEKTYIESSMVYELLASLFRLECHEKLIPQNQQKLNYVSEDLTKWVEKSRAKLTDNMKKDINVFFNYESFLGLSLIQPIWKNGCYKNIEDFFSFIDNYSAKDLVKSFFNTGYVQKKMLQSIDNPMEVKAFLNNSSLPEVEKWKLAYFCSAPEETKARFITLLKDFYITVFKENLDMLQKSHNESINYLEEKLRKNPYKVLEKLIEFGVENTKDEIILIPSYYYNTTSLLSYFEDDKRLINIYGTSQPEFKFSDELSAEKVLAAIKVLSDENRIKTIKILNASPCYGYELSQKLGISSSTTSHHLSMLCDIGVIMPVREENKVYYQVNKDNIRKLLKQFETMLT